MIALANCTPQPPGLSPDQGLWLVSLAATCPDTWSTAAIWGVVTVTAALLLRPRPSADA